MPTFVKVCTGKSTVHQRSMTTSYFWFTKDALFSSMQIICATFCMLPHAIRGEIFFSLWNQMPVQITCNQQIIGPVHEKTNNVGSDQAGHKPGCTVTEDG